MAYLVNGKTIGDAWEKSLRLFQKATSLHRYDSMRGPCVEIEDVLITIASIVREPRISQLFPVSLSPLVEDFTEKLIEKQTGRISTINARLYHWKRRDNSSLDQVLMVIEMLRRQPESRYSIIGFWDPDIDPSFSQPSGPLVAYFRIRSGRLLSTVIIRTVDAWLGAIPALVGFANFQIYIAQAVGVPVGAMKLLALSYHLYEMDIPVVLEKLKGGQYANS